MSNRSFTFADFEAAEKALDAVVSNNLRRIARDDFRETPIWDERERAEMHAQNASIMKALYLLRYGMLNGVDIHARDE